MLTVSIVLLSRARARVDRSVRSAEYRHDRSGSKSAMSNFTLFVRHRSPTAPPREALQSVVLILTSSSLGVNKTAKLLTFHIFSFPLRLSHTSLYWKKKREAFEPRSSLSNYMHRCYWKTTRVSLANLSAIVRLIAETRNPESRRTVYFFERSRLESSQRREEPRGEEGEGNASVGSAESKRRSDRRIWRMTLAS